MSNSQVNTKAYSNEELQAELEKLRTERAEMQAALAKANKPKRETTKLPHGNLSVAVSDKGAVSIYGMGKFPVTLYAEQLIKVLANGAELVEFIKANDAKLTRKAKKAA